MNALMLRAKRCLSQMDASSLEFLKINQLLNNYTELLIKSQAGIDNDAEIENVEDDLLSLLEGK
jgi:hypothetical protein